MTAAGPPKNVQFFDSTSYAPSTGKFEWKEDSCSLEFISNTPNEKQDRKKAAQAKQLHFQTSLAGSKKSEELVSVRDKLRKKKVDDSTLVSVEDVKGVAISMIGEVEHVPPAFWAIFPRPEINELLVFTLKYFESFFLKYDYESRPNPMKLEPSRSEKKMFQEMCEKLEAAQRLVGQHYCALLMNIKTNTHKQTDEQHAGHTLVIDDDRNTYECIYTFLTFVVWITFRRRDFDMIKAEVGRLMRSNAFNPSVRVKHYNPEHDDDGNEKPASEARKISPAEYRRLYLVRPPIKSLLNQNSPAVACILPQSSTGPDAARSIGTQLRTNAKLDLDKTLRISQYAEEIAQQVRTTQLKIGVVGDKMNQYSTMTLTLISSETDETDQANGGEQTLSMFVAGMATQQAAAQPTQSTRPDTNMSSATDVLRETPGED